MSNAKTLTLGLCKTDGSEVTKRFHKELTAVSAISEALGAYSIDADGTAASIEPPTETTDATIVSVYLKKAGLGFETLAALTEHDVQRAEVAEGAESALSDDAPEPVAEFEPEVDLDEATQTWIVTIAPATDEGAAVTAGPFPTRELAESFLARLTSHPREASRQARKRARDSGEITEAFGATTITLLDANPEATLPRQAKGVLSGIAEACGEGDSVTVATALPIIGEHINTVQTPKRIYTFYRKALVEAGAIALN